LQLQACNTLPSIRNNKYSWIRKEGGNFKGVGRKLQRCWEKASKASRESSKHFKGVGRKLQRCREKASKVSEESFKGVGESFKDVGRPKLTRSQ
jgi:hypothetical protein